MYVILVDKASDIVFFDVCVYRSDNFVASKESSVCAIIKSMSHEAKGGEKNIYTTQFSQQRHQKNQRLQKCLSDLFVVAF